MSIAAIIPFGLAAAALILSVRHFGRRGFLLNNAWVYATREEREQMDTAPWYRQTAVCLLLISLIFALIGLYAITFNSLFLIAEAVVVSGLLGYAVFSTRAITKRTKAVNEKQP